MKVYYFLEFDYPWEHVFCAFVIHKFKMVKNIKERRDLWTVCTRVGQEAPFWCQAFLIKMINSLLSYNERSKAKV